MTKKIAPIPAPALPASAPAGPATGNTRRPIRLLRWPTEPEMALLREMMHDSPRLRLRLRAKTILLVTRHPSWGAGYAGMQAGYDSRVPGGWWVRRWNEQGLPGLQDLPRPGGGRKKKRRKRRAG